MPPAVSQARIPPATGRLGGDDRARLLDSVRKARRYAAWQSKRSAMAYLGNVVIDSPPEPRLFRDVAEPWQWALASRLVPALEAATGTERLHARPPYAGPRFFWLTLPRGHDKTGLIARLTSWALAFGRNPIRAVAAAADREQAALLLDFMQAEARLNPWLMERLQFANWKATGLETGAALRVLSADAHSSYGLKEDVLLFDELTHWPKPDLWRAVISGTQKRDNAVVVIITNAGMLGTWQRDVFELAKASPFWYVYEAPGNLAGWMDAGKIADLRRMVPAGLARRLYDNVWIDPSEESGFCTRAEAYACVDPDLNIETRGRANREYVGSVDYGITRDRCVCCVGHLEEPGGGGRVILDRMDVFEGKRFPGGRVLVDTVERWMTDMHDAFRPLRRMVVDHYQMEGSIQRLSGHVPMERFEARGGKSNYELAANLRNLLVNRRVAWPAGCGDVFLDGKPHTLADEMSEVLIRAMSYGFRLDHDKTRFDDRVVSLGQLALSLVKGESQIELATDGRFF